MSEPIRVLVSGAGNMGRVILEAVDTDGSVTPVGAMGQRAVGGVEAEESITAVGVVDKLAATSMIALASGRIVPLFSDAVEAMQQTQPHVVIDFTNAAWTPVLADAALAHGVRMVIGTTGLPQAFVDELAKRCADRKLGSLIAANFTIGAVLMMHFAKIAARFFESAEIIELHHDAKVDAPSGTSITTARGMIDGRDGKPFARNVPDAQPIVGTRAGAYEGITIHSVRLRGLFAHQEVLLGGSGETLTIRHDSMSREAYNFGVLMAVREVMNRDRLVVGLDALMGVI